MFDLSPSVDSGNDSDVYGGYPLRHIDQCLGLEFDMSANLPSMGLSPLIDLPCLRRGLP